MKKILITGATGFLGRRTAEYFAKRNEVFSPSHAELDITSDESVKKYLSDKKPDAVINCAGMSDIKSCSDSPAYSWKMNFSGCLNLAAETEKLGIRMISCSTDQVYSGSFVSEPHRETETVFPTSLYAWEKVSAEKECMKVNSDCVFLRLAWMYDIQTLCETEHSDFARTFLSALHSGKELKYPVNDCRGITYVYDVIRNLEKALYLDGGVYNFGSPNNRNTYETVLEIMNRLYPEKAKPLADTDSFSDHKRNLTMDQEKLNSCGIVFPDTVERLTEVLSKTRI